MYNPEKYVKVNNWQKNDVNNILNKYIKKMLCKSNEIVLDVGCGPGDVTSNILYPLIKNVTQQLIGVDISKEMIIYAKKNYSSSIIDFKILDIGNSEDCNSYLHSFDKIFSFYCLHWVRNKINAINNMHSMLKNNGEIFIQFLLSHSLVETYKFMDVEWQIYIQKLMQISQNFNSEEEIKIIFTKLGFKIIGIESSVQKYTYPNFLSFLSAFKTVDDLYNILPLHLHDAYSIHFQNKVLEKQIVKINPITGETTMEYIPIIIHAIKQ